METLEALHAASSSVARLDERLRLDPLGPALRTWFLTQEARGVVYAAGGMLVHEADLVALLDPCGTPLFSKALRSAEDVHAALTKSVDWSREGPSPESIMECFALSEDSNPRRSKETAEGAAENDAIAFKGIFDSHFSTRSPETAAETLRQLFNFPGFLGQSRRMALLATPFLLSAGFSAPRVLLPFASSLGRIEAERMADAVHNQDAFLELFLETTDHAARRAYDALSTFSRLSQDASVQLGKRRSGSRHQAMVHLFLGRPYRSIGQLASELDMTPEGAGFVLDLLLKQGIVVQHNTENQKRRLFALRKALGL